MTKPGNAILKRCARKPAKFWPIPVLWEDARLLALNNGGGSDIHRTLAKGFDSRREVFASIRRL